MASIEYSWKRLMSSTGLEILDFFLNLKVYYIIGLCPEPDQHSPHPVS
jgi:hypothetical protein